MSVTSADGGGMRPLTFALEVANRDCGGALQKLNNNMNHCE